MSERTDQSTQETESQAQSSPRVVSKPATPTGSTAKRAADAFISPRVLDQNAYDQISTELRGIMTETADRAVALREAAEHADETRKQLSEATQSNREQLALTAKLLKALNAKAESLDSAISTAESKIDATAELESGANVVLVDAMQRLEECVSIRIDELVDGMQADIQSRIDSVVDNALTAAIEERIISASEQVRERAAEQIEIAKGTINSLSEAADERLVELERRGAVATRGLEDAINDAKINPEDLIEQARTAVTQNTKEVLEHALGPAIAKIKGTGQSIDTEMQNASKKAIEDAKNAVALVRDETVADLASKTASLDKLLKQVSQAHQEMRDELHTGATLHLVRMREAIDDATSLLGYNPTKGQQPPETPAPNSLEAVVRRTLATRNETQDLMRRLESATGEAKVRADDIEESVLSAVNVFNDLLAKKAQLDRVIEDAITRSNAASESLSEQAQRSKQIVDPVIAVRDEVERLTQQLESMVDEGRTIAQIADTACEDLRSANATAAEATANLGPWKRVLIDADADAPLPDGLQKIATKFRDEIGRPLIKMASAMNMVASGAETELRPTEGGAQIVISQRAKKPNPQSSQQPQSSSRAKAGTESGHIPPLQVLNFRSGQGRASA